MQEIFPENTQDEEQAVGTLRDDEIRKDGMGRATAVAGAAQDSDLMPDTFSTNKVDQIALVIAVNI